VGARRSYVAPAGPLPFVVGLLSRRARALAHERPTQCSRVALSERGRDVSLSCYHSDGEPAKGHAMTFTIQGLEQEANKNPYTAGVKLIAYGVGELLNEPRSHDGSDVNEELVRYAESIWRAAQRVLLWWTPARVEEEALRRAGDEVEPSIIAQEHHLLLGVFMHWQGLLFRWAPSIDDGVTNIPSYIHTDERNRLKRALYLRAALVDALGVLERKAASAEARAMDFRLRADHQKIMQLIAGHELVSRIQQLIDTAARNTAGQSEIRRLVEELVPVVANAERALGSIDNAVDYVADKIRQHEAREPGKVKRNGDVGDGCSR
jgi:hypothetical protein